MTNEKRSNVNARDAVYPFYDDLYIIYKERITVMNDKRKYKENNQHLR